MSYAHFREMLLGSASRDGLERRLMSQVQRNDMQDRVQSAGDQRKRKAILSVTYEQSGPLGDSTTYLLTIPRCLRKAMSMLTKAMLAESQINLIGAKTELLNHERIRGTCFSNATFFQSTLFESPPAGKSSQSYQKPLPPSLLENPWRLSLDKATAALPTSNTFFFLRVSKLDGLVIDAYRLIPWGNSYLSTSISLLKVGRFA